MLGRNHIIEFGLTAVLFWSFTACSAQTPLKEDSPAFIVLTGKDYLLELKEETLELSWAECVIPSERQNALSVKMQKSGLTTPKEASSTTGSYSLATALLSLIGLILAL